MPQRIQDHQKDSPPGVPSKFCYQGQKGYHHRYGAMGRKYSADRSGEKCTYISFFRHLFRNVDMRDDVDRSKHLQGHKDHQDSHKGGPPMSGFMHHMANGRGHGTKYSKCHRHSSCHCQGKTKSLSGICFRCAHTGKEHRYRCQRTGSKRRHKSRREA